MEMDKKYYQEYQKMNQELLAMNQKAITFIKTLVAALKHMEEEGEIIFSLQAKRTFSSIMENFKENERITK